MPKTKKYYVADTGSIDGPEGKPLMFSTGSEPVKPGTMETHLLLLISDTAHTEAQALKLLNKATAALHKGMPLIIADKTYSYE